MMVKDKYAYMVCVKCWTYNQSRFIEDALNGFCMQQTDFPYVCVIVDDASTDGEQGVIGEYLKNNFLYIDNTAVRNEETEDYTSIFARHKTNKNCFFAVIFLKYNHYQKKSKEPYIKCWTEKSKYIAMCEGDDYWIVPFKLQKQVDYMETHPECSMCCHNAYRLNSDTGRRVGLFRIYNSSRTVRRLHLFRDGGFLPLASYLMRQSMFGDRFTAFPIHKMAGDIRINVFASIVGDVYYQNDPMSVYRLNPMSVTHLAMKDRQKSIERQNYFINWYKNVDEYTEFKYHKEFDASIAFCEARIIRLEKRYFHLWNPRYWPYLGYMTPITRLGLLIGMLGLSFVPDFGRKLKKKLKMN